MVELESLPEIIVGGVPLNSDTKGFGHAAGMAATGGLAAIGRSMSAAIDTQNHTVGSMIVFLHRRVNSTRYANERAGNWLGSMTNKLTGENPNYVILSGHHLIQCLNMTDDGRSMNIQPKSKCGLRLDIAENILNRLKNRKNEH